MSIGFNWKQIVVIAVVAVIAIVAYNYYQANKTKLTA
jgi:predicted negative regulator of RcsB-dependent stress response